MGDGVKGVRTVSRGVKELAKAARREGRLTGRLLYPLWLEMAIFWRREVGNLDLSARSDRIGNVDH